MDKAFRIDVFFAVNRHMQGCCAASDIIDHNVAESYEFIVAEDLTNDRQTFFFSQVNTSFFGQGIYMVNLPIGRNFGEFAPDKHGGGTMPHHFIVFVKQFDADDHGRAAVMLNFGKSPGCFTGMDIANETHVEIDGHDPFAHSGTNNAERGIG